MPLFILFLVIIALFMVPAAISKESKPRKQSKRHYFDSYDRYEDDYADFETSSARGDRNYLSDNPSKNYSSYYSQVYDDAIMGDECARDELRSEYGEVYEGGW